MAKQRGPVASYFSGKVGEVVGASLKGGEYTTRTYKKHIKNPNTLRQRVSRLRMSTAAKLAAGLAPAIQAGFGKAAGSTRMYPRNMFVRDIVKIDGMGALTIEGTTATVGYEGLKVSERIGISSLPSATIAAGSASGQIVATIAALPVVDVLPAGKMGVVVVAYNPVKNTSVLNMVPTSTTATSTLTLNCPTSWVGDEVHIYAFCKLIPESKNDVGSETEPWKYPAETGDSVYVGSASIA